MSVYEIQAVLIALLCVVAVATLIALAFRRRLRQTSHLEAANQVPAEMGIPFLGVEGEYISTTFVDRPLERVEDAGLSFKSIGAIDVHPQGLVLVRAHDSDIFVPSHDIVSVDRDNGIIGKFVEKKGLVTVTWLLGDQLVTSGFRARYAADTQRLIDASREFYPHIVHYREPAQSGAAKLQEFDDHE
jgi:hypothetical protein